MKYFDLGSDLKIPALGFGTWKLQGEDCLQATLKALEGGYRHIDTADAYDNHSEVKEAIVQSRITRSDLFITTKVWRDSIDKQGVYNSAQRFLEELGLDYIDLLLIHWPNKDIPIKESLEAFEELRTKKLIKAIGVSNFTIRHLEEALKTGVKLNNNQVEYHPTLNQEDLLKFCQDNDILLTAYSPIARGEDLNLPLIKEIAQKYDRSPSQVILNWIISKGIVAIPKSSKEEHIRDNFKTLDWELSLEDIQKIDDIGGHNRVVKPAFAEFD